MREIEGMWLAARDGSPLLFVRWVTCVCLEDDLQYTIQLFFCCYSRSTLDFPIITKAVLFLTSSVLYSTVLVVLINSTTLPI